MKIGQVFRSIGILLIVIGIISLFSTLTDYRYLVTLFRTLGLDRPSEIAYKFNLMFEPLKPAILITGIGMIIAGGYTISKQQ